MFVLYHTIPNFVKRKKKKPEKNSRENNWGDGTTFELLGGWII